MRFAIPFLFFVATEVLSFKFLIYSPLFGHSHTTFMARIADTLFEAGHDVTVLSPLIDDAIINKTGIKSGAKLIRLEQDPRAREKMPYVRTGMFKDVWTMQPSLTTVLTIRRNFSQAFVYTCEALASNTSLHDFLREEKFDVGIAEPFSVCGFGLFDHLKLRATIGTASFVQLDLISWFLGEPLAPSYVPSMLPSDGPKMTFFEKMKNIVGTIAVYLLLTPTFRNEAQALSNVLGKDYSNYGDLIAKTSFMFSNSNPYLNFPRPLLHKTVEIGGISVDTTNVGKLSNELSYLLDERNHSVFISFGSISKSKDMPEDWKTSILKFCESLPEVTFIWKYEEPSSLAPLPPNVHLSSWLPQTALLADPRLSIFITHGGLGSTNEIAYFGKPTIMIPVFGDQTRNARMLAQHGGAIVLQKTSLADPEVLKQSVQTILNDKKFASSAARLASILREKPISPKELVVSHAEFVAKFGSLPQLDPYGRQLNILQYYLIDVFVFLIVSIGLIVGFIYYVLRFVCSKCSSVRKLKNL